jgi:hypothetical protein
MEGAREIKNQVFSFQVSGFINPMQGRLAKTSRRAAGAQMGKGKKPES